MDTQGGELAKLFVLTGARGGSRTFWTFGAETGAIARTSPARAAVNVLSSVGVELAAYSARARLSGTAPPQP